MHQPDLDWIGTQNRLDICNVIKFDYFINYEPSMSHYWYRLFCEWARQLIPLQWSPTRTPFYRWDNGWKYWSVHAFNFVFQRSTTHLMDQRELHGVVMWIPCEWKFDKLKLNARKIKRAIPTSRKAISFVNNCREHNI